MTSHHAARSLKRYRRLLKRADKRRAKLLTRLNPDERRAYAAARYNPWAWD